MAVSRREEGQREWNVFHNFPDDGCLPDGVEVTFGVQDEESVVDLVMQLGPHAHFLDLSAGGNAKLLYLAETLLNKEVVLREPRRGINATARAPGGDRPPLRSYGTESRHSVQVLPLK